MCAAVVAVGCADFTTPSGTVVDRQGDTAVVRCTGGTEVGQLTVHCVNGSWTPTPPTAGCSTTTSASAAAVQSFDFGRFALSKQGRVSTLRSTGSQLKAGSHRRREFGSVASRRCGQALTTHTHTHTRARMS